MAFPLFNAPLDPGYARSRTCVVCRCDGRPCIGLGGSDHLIVACRRCGEPTGLRVGWQDTPCLRCGAFNLWPADFSMEEATICFDCLNEGHAAISHDSDLGFVEWPDASRGVIAGGTRTLREGRAWSCGWTNGVRR